MNPDSELAKRAVQLKEPLVAGISGHTDHLLQALRLFSYFDLQLATLASVVWLVGCDHHSCLEVLATAEFYGLPCENRPSLDRLEDMVREVEARDGDCVCPYCRCGESLALGGVVSTAPAAARVQETWAWEAGLSADGGLLCVI